jgi:hypothetical protein
MITRLEVAAGWYGEALPSGEYAVAVPSQKKLVSHVGDIPFGPESPLFVRVTNAGGFKLAGQGQDTGRTVEWGGGFWNTKPVACGVSPVIYDSFGVLHISDCSIGSQGWRYVADDGTLVTGDQSFSSPIFHLYEFTTHGDITIGQGGDGGAIAVTPQGRFVLEPGYTVFIRYNRVGDRLAVTIVKLLEGKTVLLWLDAGDVATFPREAPAPVPVPKPVPVPVPVPEPKPMPSQHADQTAAIAAIRAKYPTPLAATHPAFLIEVAKALGVLLFKKDGGSHVTLPNGVNVSQDIIVYPDREGFDILGDGEGAAIPSWSPKGQMVGDLVDVSGLTPSNGGGSTPVPAGSPGAALDATIAALKADIAALVAKLTDQAAKIAALEARPAGGNVTGIADGSTVALKSHDNGEYVTVEPDGDVNAKGPRAFGAYQLFTIEVQQ